jgi:hypothetical protein
MISFCNGCDNKFISSGFKTIKVYDLWPFLFTYETVKYTISVCKITGQKTDEITSCNSKKDG